MNIKNKLEAVLAYYERTRGVGHTQAARACVNGREALVMCHNQATCGFYANGDDVKHAKACVISRPDVWQGYNLPLVWDNYAIIKLCEDSLEEIEFQKQCLRDAQRHSEELRGEVKFQNDRAGCLYYALCAEQEALEARRGWYGLKMWFRDTFGGERWN